MEQLISVIIPVYNVAPYLPRCLDSIAAQTYRNLQIILVDDGAKDGSDKICDAYAAKDPRFVVYHQANAGVSAARNAGLQIATGDYLVFVDADDFVPADALQALYDRLQADGSDMAVGRHALQYEDGSLDESPYAWLRDGVFTPEEVFAKLGEDQDFPVIACTKLFKKELFVGVTFPPFICGEDIAVFPTTTSKCKKISVVDKIVYYYFQRATSAVHVYNPKARMHSLENDLALTRYLWDNGYLSGAAKWYYQTVNWAYQMKDRKGALAMIRKYLDPKVGGQLLARQKPKTWIVWLALYVPAIKTVAEKLRGR